VCRSVSEPLYKECSEEKIASFFSVQDSEITGV